MNAIQIVKGLGPIDLKSVRRDPMLRWILALPVCAAVPSRLILPRVMSRLAPLLGIDLLPFYAPLMSYVLLVLAPIVCGMVVGFLLLDQRDDGTLAALRVTPLPPNSYLAYRLAAPMLLSLPMTMLAFPIAGLTQIDMPSLFLTALVAAPLAPLAALGLAIFAANKVQGFALMKISNLLLIAPLVAAFVPAMWRPLFGLAPTYWPAQLIWGLQAGDASAWLYAPAGLAYQALLLALLLRRFNRQSLG